MTKAMSQSHKTDNSIAFFIKPFFRFVNVTCRFRSSLMRSMRIFFRPIDLFYTLSSVFLSVFSGSQSREREKKRRGKESRLDFQTLSKPRLLPRKAAIKQSATLVKPFDVPRPTDSLFLSLTLTLERDTETQRHRDFFEKSSSEELWLLFFLFFSIKNYFFSRSFVYFLLSLLLFQRKKTVSHFAPSFLPRERDDRQTRSHALSEEPLMRPTRERDREGIARSLSDSLLSSVLKREDFFFAPFVVVKTVFWKT